MKKEARIHVNRGYDCTGEGIKEEEANRFLDFPQF
jgi:hypothetical protein